MVSGRVLNGVCVGVQAVVGSVFMPEMVQVELRNVFSAFPAFLGNLGEWMTHAPCTTTCTSKHLLRLNNSCDHNSFQLSANSYSQSLLRP